MNISKITTIASILTIVALVMASGCQSLNVMDMLEPDNEVEGPPVVSLVPTTDIRALVVGDHVKVDIRITGGKGVAGYATLVTFDSTALKYIGASQGDYLPQSGLWINPFLSDNSNYALKLHIGDTTSSGELVVLGQVGPTYDDENQPILQGDRFIEFKIEDFFFPLPDMPPQAQELEKLAVEGAVYWGVSLLASSPFGDDAKPTPVDGDGTLATLTFEVVEAKTDHIAIFAVNLSDTNDEPLEVTLHNHILTLFE